MYLSRYFIKKIQSLKVCDIFFVTVISAVCEFEVLVLKYNKNRRKLQKNYVIQGSSHVLIALPYFP